MTTPESDQITLDAWRRGETLSMVVSRETFASRIRMVTDFWGLDGVIPLPERAKWVLVYVPFEQGVVSYHIRIRVEVPGLMRPREGLSAVATIVLHEEKNVLRVPQLALHGTFDAPVVMVKTSLGIDERKVVLGDTDDYWVAVREGLSEGDQVIMEASQAFTSRSGGIRR